MYNLAEWLANPARRDLVAAWGLILTGGGTILTLLGLALTYVQVNRARLSSNRIKAEIKSFDFRKRRNDAFGDVGEARTAMEAAAKLLRLNSWVDAATSYDDARKAMVRVQASSIDLPEDLAHKLRIIIDHLSAFSNAVDKTVGTTAAYPDNTKVLISIRRHVDTLSIVQSVIQKDMK